MKKIMLIICLSLVSCAKKTDARLDMLEGNVTVIFKAHNQLVTRATGIEDRVKFLEEKRK